MIIPEGFKIMRIGWERFKIGEMPLPDPGRSDYQPFKKPDNIYSEPKRWIEVDRIHSTYDTPIEARKILDDGSNEFDTRYNQFEKDEEEIYKRLLGIK